MEINGERRIPAGRQAVWDALNDPEVLQRCIPGCRSLIPNEAGDGFDAEAGVKIGPVKAGFSGSVTLADVKAPESYRIIGEGKGAAGFARGTADVRLADADGDTMLHYQVTAQVGGKLAQIGSRLLDSAAKKYTNDFFSSFETILREQGAASVPASDADTDTDAKGTSPAEDASESVPPGGLKSLSAGSWTLLTIIAVLILLWMFSG